jgi:hypothetical protein
MSNIKVDIVQEMMPFCIQKVSKREGQRGLQADE